LTLTHYSLKVFSCSLHDLRILANYQLFHLLVIRLGLPVKEVIQPHLPVRLPCYDFTPVTSSTFGIPLPKPG